MKELVCTPKRISLEKESPRAMAIHTSARHNALPARVGENSRRNISFGASCSFNQWHLWASRCASSVACARRSTRLCPVRKSRESRARWTPPPLEKNVHLVLSIIIYRPRNLRDALARPSRLLIAINCGDYVSGIRNFRIINHRNTIPVNSTRCCSEVCYTKFINHDEFQFMTTRGYRHSCIKSYLVT